MTSARSEVLGSIRGAGARMPFSGTEEGCDDGGSGGGPLARRMALSEEPGAGTLGMARAASVTATGWGERRVASGRPVGAAGARGAATNEWGPVICLGMGG